MKKIPIYILGTDGIPMTADIFFGVIHYQRLRHMVSDKFQVRSQGKYIQLPVYHFLSPLCLHLDKLFVYIFFKDQSIWLRDNQSREDVEVEVSDLVKWNEMLCFRMVIFTRIIHLFFS